MITIRIAELNIGVDNRFDYIEKRARDYLTDEPPLFTVSASDEELLCEKNATEIEYPDGYLEYIVVYRKIADRLPEFDGFVFHGAVLNLDGRAYAFTARSGVGKTTHTRLWLSEFGERVHYLNGDKPIIRFIDGIPYACGTPWQGKEGYGTNEKAPLSGIAFLARGTENTAQPVPPSEVVTRLITQIYIPRGSASALSLTMRLANRLIGSVRLVDLKCNMDPEAAHVSYAALSGENN